MTYLAGIFILSVETILDQITLLDNNFDKIVYAAVIVNFGLRTQLGKRK